MICKTPIELLLRDLLRNSQEVLIATHPDPKWLREQVMSGACPDIAASVRSVNRKAELFYLALHINHIVLNHHHPRSSTRD